ncbi:MAG: choice-of-anchor U domain-containing protein [Pseudomonadota bacterium]
MPAQAHANLSVGSGVVISLGNSTLKMSCGDITFTDSGSGDDDGEANGVIVDPSGLGEPPEIRPVALPGESGGCFLSALAWGSAL